LNINYGWHAMHAQMPRLGTTTYILEMASRLPDKLAKPARAH